MKRSLFFSTFLATLISITFGSVVIGIGYGTQPTGLGEGLLGAFAAFFPSTVAAWWLFRKRLAHMPRREALVVATTFGVSAPISMIIIMPFAQIPGGYLAGLGRPFGLLGSVLVLLIGMTLLCFATSYLARSFVRKHFT